MKKIGWRNNKNKLKVDEKDYCIYNEVDSKKL